MEPFVSDEVLRCVGLVKSRIPARTTEILLDAVKQELERRDAKRGDEPPLPLFHGIHTNDLKRARDYFEAQLALEATKSAEQSRATPAQIREREFAAMKRKERRRDAAIYLTVALIILALIIITSR